jgi:hypothetical protein
MGDPQEAAAGAAAGAPAPAPSSPPPLTQTSKISPELAAVAGMKGTPRGGERADEISNAIRTAKERTKLTEKDKLLQEAMEKSETAEMRRALGLDVPFDVKKIITTGSVERRGMQVGDNLYLDMHTLTKMEDIMAERLVEELIGPMALTKSYLESKFTATLAMAITRVNSELFPAPSYKPEDRGTDPWREAWEKKKNLFEMLLNMRPDDVDNISLIYTKLDRMDMLNKEDEAKKSG